jgi:hypothetical protein
MPRLSPSDTLRKETDMEHSESGSNTKIGRRNGSRRHRGGSTNGKAGLARIVEYLIGGAAAILLCYFGWLQISGTEVLSMVKSIPGRFVFRFAMIVYYACWVNGAIFDTHYQDSVYVNVSKARVIFGAVIATIALAAMFGFLCACDTYRQFCVGLAVFFLVNLAGWVYIVKWIAPKAIEESELQYLKNNSHVDVERLGIVALDYTSGPWQWYRFAMGAGLILVMNGLAFSNMTSGLSKILWGISPDMIQSLSMLLFVVAMEGWIWYMRLRLSIGLGLLKGIDESYELTPKQDADPAAECGASRAATDGALQ